MSKIIFLLAVLTTVGSAIQDRAEAQCLQVADDRALAINPTALQSLEPLGLSRREIFAALNEISQTETGGCWASPAGNFDGQLVSVGTAQWNYGSESLQPLLRSYRRHFLTVAAFDADIAAVMPKFGTEVFSDGCLATSRRVGKGQRSGGLSAECRSFLNMHQRARGNLDSELAAEFEALFNSKTMRQIQVDRFTDLLGRVRSDLMRLFPRGKPNPVQIQWAIDTKVQQGTFPSDSSLKRLRGQLSSFNPAQIRARELSTIDWYRGLCNGWDQDGVKYDVDYNVGHWTALINSGPLTQQQNELWAFTTERSRTALGEDGRWQALTFERRIKIVVGVGSVGGNRRVRLRTT